MSISSAKLQSFIQSNGFMIQRMFLYPDFMLIEILSLHSVNKILLRMPLNSDISLDIPKFYLQEVTDSFDLNQDEVDQFTHVSESFIENAYSDLNNSIRIPVERRKIPMSQYLNETYKQKVILDDLQGEEKLIQNDIYRQLKRLKYCIKGMTHKLAIMHAPLIGVIHDNDTIKLYYCDALKIEKADTKLFVIIDFNIFYDKIAMIEKDCTQITEGIYTILTNNQRMHSKNVQTILEKKENIIQQTEVLQSVKIKYENYIRDYLLLLEEWYSYHQIKMNEYIELKNTKTDSIHNDMKRTNQLRKLEKEIQELEKTKSELVQTVREIRTKYEQLTLSMDTILFDNIVMLDKIFKNFDKLRVLEEKK